jgi:hypothetical protein
MLMPLLNRLAAASPDVLFLGYLACLCFVVIVHPALSALGRFLFGRT